MSRNLGLGRRTGVSKGRSQFLLSDSGRTDYAGASTEWACTRKKAYPDEKFARRVAARIREEEGVNVVAYACTRCGRFHIGRAPGA